MACIENTNDGAIMDIDGRERKDDQKKKAKKEKKAPSRCNAQVDPISTWQRAVIFASHFISLVERRGLTPIKRSLHAWIVTIPNSRRCFSCSVTGCLPAHLLTC